MHESHTHQQHHPNTSPPPGPFCAETQSCVCGLLPLSSQGCGSFQFPAPSRTFIQMELLPAFCPDSHHPRQSSALNVSFIKAASHFIRTSPRPQFGHECPLHPPGSVGSFRARRLWTWSWKKPSAETRVPSIKTHNTDAHVWLKSSF